MTLTYDVENRVIQAVNSNGTEQYGYSPDNRRVYQKTPAGSQQIHFYGANGDRLATYTYFGNGVFQVLKTNLYFAGRMIRQSNTATFIDRLGSDRNGTRYYPYGEEYSATGNDRNKFATYFRDSSTGLDYALNRYYSSSMGRFLTPDPFGGSPSLERPNSWNRYAYVENDPVNYYDPAGLAQCPAGATNCIDVTAPAPDPLELFVWGMWLTPTIAYGLADGLGEDWRAERTTPQQKREQVKAWIGPGQEKLQKFTTQSADCILTLGLIGLKVSDVAQWAKDAEFKNVNIYHPTLAKEMADSGTDFTIDVNSTNGVWYQSDAFWQQDFNMLLGTMVHEFAHLNDRTLTDKDLQTNLAPLGVRVDKDTTNISRRIAKDCFRDVKNP
jgi:RHS repeat-associated protein